ncbi:GntR family transcriptional regulator [Kaustia mangrovi]|uniref:GntR family transcriptional regulator n=1 Tax=Kaustia mangrovi TaxID=2593653 RepID=A0A7S8C6A4_9HYPH|nr:GntR family transcriptional regulator [Kaustia mangrovi]QPC44177.1 GntR family transcriptional regulator [Kaustia mangrovi]
MTLVNDKKRAAGEGGDAPDGTIKRLSSEGVAPLYEVVKRHISEAILLGTWPPGTVLPGEVALAQKFGVAVGTVRRALADLTAEGLLSRRRKTGTVVTGRSPHHSLRFFFQYFRLHGRDGALQRSTTSDLSVEVGRATTEERAGLELEEGAEVLRLRRVRNVDGRPIMHDRFVLPADRLPGFPHDGAEVPDLLYLHLLERYGIRISAVRERLSAELASDEDAERLGLDRPAAVMVIEEIAYDQAGAPVIVAAHRATTQDHCYINEIR